MKARAGIAVLGWLFLSPGLLHGQEWVQITPADGGAPLHRSRAAAIYDPRGHRMVVFGGTSPLGKLNDVWALDLQTNRWIELTPPTDGPTPEPRLTPSTVYDPQGHRMVMWSGQGKEGVFFNDIWAFDLAAHTWTELTPADPKPNKRYGTVSILDPQSRNMAVFAGFTDEGRFGDTWRFDMESGAWTRIFENEGPGRRCLHSASLDRARQRMIIYGGQRSGPLGDIWAFDLSAHTWTELTPADSPPGRFFASQVYVPYNDRAVIFGGNLGEDIRTAEVWAFDLKTNTWQQLSPQGNPPPERDGAVAIFVEAEGRMVVFGGGGAGVKLYNDTWSLNGLSPPAPTAVEESALPGRFALFQNYPNPANPSTTIAYDLPSPTYVRLDIYDLLGQEARQLVDQAQPAGRWSISWDGTDAEGRRAASGVYLYRLETREGAQTKKLVLVR